MWSNLYLSGLVALIGISAPIGLSFILQKLLNATPVQAFAAGAALCSTSLGTTFTILSTSGLDKSRLGVILSSAAMLDDVAGLVMVQVISNLGTSVESFSAITVIRPVFVSIAFAIIVPLICRLVVQPFTKYAVRACSKNESWVGKLVATPAAAFVAYTLVLLGLVTGSSYAGTSNLFAAYIAGAIINWWDALVLGLHETNGQTTREKKAFKAAAQPSSSPESSSTQAVGEAQLQQGPPTSESAMQQEQKHSYMSGIAIYERLYAPAVNFILKPFFFVSHSRASCKSLCTDSSAGVYRFLHTNHPDVPRCNLLARYGLHYPDDSGQTNLRTCTRTLQQSTTVQLSAKSATKKRLKASTKGDLRSNRAHIQQLYSGDVNNQPHSF